MWLERRKGRDLSRGGFCLDPRSPGTRSSSSTAQSSADRIFRLETALVVLVPEAESLVRPFRDRHDPSAAAGMPAHITLLYPFKAPGDISAAVLGDLRLCFAGFRQFDFSLAAIRQFAGGVLYLAPEPDEPFRRLTLAICERYPETPPYGGRYSNIVPHLTVADLTDGRQFDRVAEEFARASQGKLPIRATAREAALMERRAGNWQLRTALPLD
jgi:2'-5' RNA ligase